MKGENSSVGRASPCQGGGRGFESRFSLDFDSAQSPRVEFFFLHTSPARVVELVDTPDLKSCGHFARAGSSPASSTEKPCESMDLRGFLFLKDALFQIFSHPSDFLRLIRWVERLGCKSW